ncbi:hypothetical protein HDV00_008705, partial [Rhizophlyctis rosea]
LTRILTDPKNALVKQYREIFARSGMELLVHPEALKVIARSARRKGTGARGLRRILETLLQDALYDFPGTDVAYAVITPACARGEEGVRAFGKGEERSARRAAGEREVVGLEYEKRPVVVVREDFERECARG